ncbi:M12 family metallopeptidase [Prosthecobacter sp.]|uniref:M12 family metallopeptidase n=1 Tax=Prosthecobacter sp. TaxID=1965333 RepID=UPI003784D65D
MNNYIPCSIKTLPEELREAAAATAVAINPTNAPAVHMLKALAPDVVIPPAHLAVLTSKYWGAGGVQLTVGFLDNPAADLRARIISHMNAWNATSNVTFVESAVNPQVRISRANSGYWSYLGTDIGHIAAGQPTMNLQGFTMNTPDSEFHRVVRHETGHTLGFPHEHMRSEIVNRIDREKAIAYFMATQGWTREQVIAQVLTPLDNSALMATAHADINSIMCYWLPGSIMTDGVAVDGGLDIDAQDAQFAASLYPKPAIRLNLLVHLQDIGDVVVHENQFGGTRGQSRRLEGFQIDFGAVIPGLGCRYMAHLQDIGDVPWVDAGHFIGTRGQSRRLEGFAIELTGPAAANFNVFYMAHLQDIGDTGLYSNGQFCGTRGQSRRVEGMLVRIEYK